MQSTSNLLSDGISKPFEVVLLSSEVESGEPTEILPFAKGYGEDAVALGALAEQTIAFAEAEGRPLCVVLHRVPNTYNLADRTARFAQVVEYATHNGDLPVRLAGHSLGYPQALEVAENKLSRGHTVLSLTGICPNGLSPANRDLAGAAQAVGLALHEAISLPELLLRSPVARRIGANVMSHIASHPIRALAEGRTVLTHSFAERTVDMHGKLMTLDGTPRMRLLLAMRDGVCPGKAIRNNLLAAGLPESDLAGLLVDLGGNHGAPLTETSQAANVYRAVMLQDPSPTANLQTQTSR